MHACGDALSPTGTEDARCSACSAPLVVSADARAFGAARGRALQRVTAMTESSERCDCG